MNKHFNVGIPTQDNIDYAFKNLLFYLTASSKLNLYKNDKEEFQKVLLKVNKILEIYINKGKLESISEDLLQDIKYDLIDLDAKTQALKTYYAEWSLLWLDALISLRQNTIKKEKSS